MEDVIKLIKRGADEDVKTALENLPNIKTRKNITTLAKAAVEANSKDIIIILLEYGLKINTALALVVDSGNRDLIDFVLDQGADIITGLTFAIENNKEEVLDFLFARGESTNQSKENTILHKALTQTRDVNLIENLIENCSKTKTGLRELRKLVEENNDYTLSDKLKKIKGLPNRNEHEFECITGGSNALRGFSYQIKYLTLYAIMNTRRAISSAAQFELSTEVKNLVPFDDIYLKKMQDGRTTCELVQVKQGKIELSKMFSILKRANNIKEHLKGNDSIMKMFIKFDDICNDPAYSDTTKKFIFCANKTFHHDSPPCLISVGDNDCEFVDYDDLLCGVKHNKWVIEPDYVFNEIKTILFNLISGSQYFKAKNEEFKNNFNTQIEILENKNIVLGENLENNKEWPVKKIAYEGMKAIQDYKANLASCKKEIKKINKISIANIEKFKKNLPIDIEVPYTEDLPSFKKTVLTKISELSKSFDIDNNCFSYFSKYDDVVLREKIDNFAKNFIIYTNCPTSEELDDLITKEISKEFKFDIPILISEHCQQHISKWIIDFKNFKGSAFTDRDGKMLFHNIRQKIFKMYNKSYVKELQKGDVKFKQDNKRVREFLNNKNNKKILHVITKYTRLHTINVWQTALKNIKNTYNIMCSSSEYIFKSDESMKNLIDAYSSIDSKDLFILEFSDEIGNFQKVLDFSNYLKNIILINDKLKIIIIAKEDNKIATELKCMTAEYTSYHDVIELKDLKKNVRKQILQKTVNFKNNPNLLNTHLKLQDFITMSASCEVINEEILSNLFSNIPDLEIGNGEAFVSDHYNKELFIPRHILSIDIKILENCDTNLFFVTGITKTELISKLPQQEQYMRIWNENKTYKTGIELITDEVKERTNMTSAEIFTHLSRNSKTCYWLEFRNDVVYRRDTNLSNNYKFEEILIGSKRTPENLEDKIIIIANNPGEGKSTMLTHLAHSIRNKSFNSWIIRIDLRYFADDKQSSSLNDITFNVDDTIKAMELITLIAVKANSTQNYKLERKLLHSSLNGSSEVEVVLLFDGFDEISPTYKEKTCILLRALTKSNVKQLWVTTRVHLKEYLEKELEVPARMLASFIESEQIEFICKFWKWHLKNYKCTQDATEEEIFVGIVNQLRLLFDNFKDSAFDHDKEFKIHEKGSLHQLRHFIDDKIELSSLAKLSLDLWEKTIKNKDFLKNPLHLELLTKNSIQREWKLSNFPNSLLFTIYTDFVNSKLEIYNNRNIYRTSNQHTNDHADMVAVLFRDMHREIAVRTLFDPADMQLLPDMQICTKYTNFLEKLARVGLVKFYSSRAEFVHRTFAEYFYGDYLVTHLDYIVIQSAFLEKILLYDDYHMVRTFLDGFLLQYQLSWKFDEQGQTKQYPKHFQTIFDRMIIEKVIKEKNNKDENILHVAVRGGHVQIFLLIFNNVTKSEFIELVKTPSSGGPTLHLALNEGHTEMFHIIVDCVKKSNTSSRNEELELMKQINKGNMTILHTASFLGFTDIFNKIVKTLKQDEDAIRTILISSNVNGLTALHFAASEGNAKICDLIIETAEEYSLFCDLVTTCDIDGRTALLVSVTFYYSDERNAVCESILKVAEKYFDVFKHLILKKDCDQQTLLHQAARCGYVQAAEVLMRYVIKYEEIFTELISQYDYRHYTALHTAAMIGSLGIWLLILKYAERYPHVLEMLIVMRNREKETPLHISAQFNRDTHCYYILKSAIKHYATFKKLLTRTDQNKRTALHVAAMHGYSYVCTQILNSANTYKNVMKLLLMQCDEDRKTAFELAEKNGHTECCDVFLATILQSRLALRIWLFRIKSKASAKFSDIYIKVSKKKAFTRLLVRRPSKFIGCKLPTTRQITIYDLIYKTNEQKNRTPLTTNWYRRLVRLIKCRGRQQKVSETTRRPSHQLVPRTPVQIPQTIPTVTPLLRRQPVPKATVQPLHKCVDKNTHQLPHQPVSSYQSGTASSIRSPDQPIPKDLSQLPPKTVLETTVQPSSHSMITSTTRSPDQLISKNSSQLPPKTLLETTVQPSYQPVTTSTIRSSDQPRPKEISQLPPKTVLNTTVRQPLHPTVSKSMTRPINQTISRAISQLPHKSMPTTKVQSSDRCMPTSITKPQDRPIPKTTSRQPHKSVPTAIEQSSFQSGPRAITRPPYQPGLRNLTRSPFQAAPTATQIKTRQLIPRAPSQPLQHSTPRVSSRLPLVKAMKQNNNDSIPKAISHPSHQPMPKRTSQSQQHLTTEGRARLPYQPMLRTSQVPQRTTAQTSQQSESQGRTRIPLRPVPRLTSQPPSQPSQSLLPRNRSQLPHQLILEPKSQSLQEVTKMKSQSLHQVPKNSTPLMHRPKTKAISHPLHQLVPKVAPQPQTHSAKTRSSQDPKNMVRPLYPPVARAESHSQYRLMAKARIRIPHQQVRTQTIQKYVGRASTRLPHQMVLASSQPLDQAISASMALFWTILLLAIFLYYWYY